MISSLNNIFKRTGLSEIRVELGVGAKSESDFAFLCRSGAGVPTLKKVRSRNLNLKYR